ncbi:hypothetical protein ONZ45_g9417 [Pleurotus djamor]|nr:hypothetical protein ONZ45_g9417 [Pleurotus djamor]
MSTTLSGHLVESYYRNASLQRARGNLPFSQFISNIPSQPQLNRSSSLVISGMSSYLPGGHGMDASMSFSAANMSSTSFDDMSSYMELSEATASRIATLQAKLNQKLGPEYVSQRPGPGGGPKLTYAEGWKIINLANEVFGFNGWSSNIISLTTDYMDTHDDGRRHNVGVTAIVRVTLRDGVFHEDVGYGVIENAKSKGMALDKCKKEAVTDALKRALRNFGNLLGNCLYDKSYAQEVVKIKVPPPKFDKSELYRRPEFQEKETKPDVSKLDAAAASSSTNPGASSNALPSSSRVGQSVPAAAASSTRSAFNPPNHTSAPSNVATDIKGKGRAPNNLPGHGLNTPDATPANPIARQNPARGRMPPPPAFNRSVTESNPPHNTHQVPNRMPPQPNQQNSSHSSNLPLPANNLAQPPVAQPVLAEDELYTMDADESFGMSDDDAFLAVVDLGEGDLGQPIDFDEGTGAKAGLGDDASHESTGTSQDAMPPPQQVPPPQVRFQQPANRAPQTASTTAPEPSGASASNDHSSNHRPQQLVNPPKPRSVTPSMGGFHFPPGVTPPIEPPQSQMRTNGQRLTLGSGLLGINRNQPPQRRMPQGMGLSGNQPPPDASARSMGAQQQTGHHQFNQLQRGTKREILGDLEVGHDGEVKKPRR